MVRGGVRLIAATSVAAAIALAGCSSSGGAEKSQGDGLRVVASTNVYGSIATAIGGKDVEVTSIIKDPNQDPHSFEADTRTKLAISKADVVIKNGGGYDDFVTTMAKGTKATVLDAVTISGDKAPAGGELNEHVWYDFAGMRRLAADLATTFGKAEPKDKATFSTNLAAFDKALSGLQAQEKQIAAAHKGEGVAITEPVPLYLLQASGLVNKTPPAFSEAIEEGNDVSVSVLNQTLQLFKDKAVKLLAYNEQTTGTETERVLAAAKSNGIAVVPVTETLPEGKTYLGWMRSNVAAVKAALA